MATDYIPEGGQAVKLTDWVKQPTVDMLNNDLEVARTAQSRHIADITRWNADRNVKDLPNTRKGKRSSKVQPNVIKKHQAWRYPSLTEPFLNTIDMFKIEPRTFEDTAAAEQNEMVLNWQFNTLLNKVNFIDNYVRSAVDDGTVIVKVSWKREKRPAVQRVPQYTHSQVTDPQHAEAIAAQLQELSALKQQNAAEFNKESLETQESVRVFEESGEVVQTSIAGYTERNYNKVVENRPELEIMDPGNVYIDPACEGDYKKARFIIHSYEVTRSDLLKDKRFKNLNAVDWESNGTMQSGTYHTTNDDNIVDVSDRARKKVVVYEYWGWYDINGTGILEPIVCSWIGRTFIRMEKNPFPDNSFPFVLTTYQPVKRELYGESDAELLAPNQKIEGALVRGLINLIGYNANAQTGVAEGLLTNDNMKKFLAGETYQFNPNIGTPAGQIIEHNLPQLPASVLQFVQMIQRDSESLSGVSSYSAGLTGDSHGSVATGINATISSVSKREQSILKRLADGVKDIGKKIVVMNQMFMAPEEVIRVTNRGFVTVRREDLQGNFDLRIEISTNEVDERKVQDLLLVFQTIGPNLDQNIVKRIFAEIFELKKMPRLAEDIRTMEPSDEEKELSKIAVEKARLELTQMQASAGQDTAKATKAQEEAESVKLERLRSVAGLDHAEAKELQGQQGRTNLGLEILKALVTPLKEGEKAGDIEKGMDYIDVINEESVQEVNQVRELIQGKTDEQMVLILQQLVAKQLEEAAQQNNPPPQI